MSETPAPKRPRPSSSTFSLFKREVFDSGVWGRYGDTIMADSPETYDLCCLVKGEGEGGRGESDSFAHQYVANQLTMYLETVEVKKFHEVISFRDYLSPLLASNVVKPDVAVYCKSDGFPLVFFEVHSGPYECTIIKCIVLVSDQIRLHRLYDSTSDNINSITYTGFTFPTIGTKTCVAKVDVMWHEFQFMYSVEFIENPDNVASLVKKTIQKAIENKPDVISKQLQQSMGVINLSPAELMEFSECGFVQVHSQESIMIRSDSYYYKHPITPCGNTNLTKASLIKSEHVVSVSPVFLNGILFYKCEAVFFDPLQVSEASSCLLSLVMEVATAIEELHQQGFAHQDVRLPNIRFSKEFKAVLIDLDRICKVRYKPKFYRGSVMHKGEFSAAENDWMQLGLIILWTTCQSKSGISYYDVKRQEVPVEYQSDQFVCSLMNGKYTKERLPFSELQKYNSKTIQSVLEGRKSC